MEGTPTETGIVPGTSTAVPTVFCFVLYLFIHYTVSRYSRLFLLLQVHSSSSSGSFLASSNHLVSKSSVFSRREFSIAYMIYKQTRGTDHVL